MKPVLHDVVLCSQKLINHCKFAVIHSSLLKNLKIAVRQKFLATQIIKVALFLNPNFNGLNILTEALKENTLSTAKNHVRTF